MHIQLYTTQKWKSGKKWGRPGNMYHVNDVRSMWGSGEGGEERGAQLKYLPESEFVTGQAEYSLSCVNVWGLA